MATARIAILSEGAFTAAQWNAIAANALVFRDLTDAQVARLQTAYQGTTSQMAQAVLLAMLKALRAQSKNRGGSDQRAIDEAVLNANQATFDAAFDVDWPPEP